MKKDWRDVLILRVLEGLTAEEACAVLKIKSTVCCTRLYRAKAELQKRVLRAKLFDIYKSHRSRAVSNLSDVMISLHIQCFSLVLYKRSNATNCVCNHESAP
ncbi:MAG: sigma factor-like helix-turn-helix DNA-binding protein [Clostridium fessum]